MGKEIERKFLVIKEKWQPDSEGKQYRQGYLSTAKERVVRVRVADGKGFLTIKGKTEGFSRAEFEYEIPLKDAEVLLNTLCERPLIEKLRYQMEYEGTLWEVDVFLGENQGLVVAEVELKSETQSFVLPQWIGEEVSLDPRYYNVNLLKRPFTKWSNP